MNRAQPAQVGRKSLVVYAAALGDVFGNVCNAGDGHGARA